MKLPRIPINKVTLAIAAVIACLVILCVVFESARPKVYVLSFDGNGADGDSMESLRCTQGEYVLLPDCGYTMQGYIFDGWFCDGEEYYDCGTRVTPTRDTIFKAKWIKITYSACFIRGGSETKGHMDSLQIEPGETIRLPDCEYEREGYEFKSWTCDSKEYEPGDEIKINKTMIFVAKWEKRHETTEMKTENDSFEPTPLEGEPISYDEFFQAVSVAGNDGVANRSVASDDNYLRQNLKGLASALTHRF